MLVYLYQNHIAPSYEETPFYDSDDTLFHSSSPYNENNITDLFFMAHDGDKSNLASNNKAKFIDSMDICTELAQAISINDVAKFIHNYGTLIPSYLSINSNCPYHTSEITKNTFDTNFNKAQTSEPPYDCMFYKHFRYYQVQMSEILKLHKLLQPLNPDTKIKHTVLQSLITTCNNIIKNEYFKDMLFLEYEHALDKEEMLKLFQQFPLCQYRYNYAYHTFINGNKSMISPYIERTFSNYPQSSYKDLLVKIAFDSDISNLPSSYLDNNKRTILEFAHNVFEQFLGFEIREAVIYPSIEPIQKPFPTLACAIFYYFYFFVKDHIIYKECAYELCPQKIFPCYASRANQRKFCSDACSHNNSSRNSKQRKKQQLEQKES